MSDFLPPAAREPASSPPAPRPRVFPSTGSGPALAPSPGFPRSRASQDPVPRPCRNPLENDFIARQVPETAGAEQSRAPGRRLLHDHASKGCAQTPGSGAITSRGSEEPGLVGWGGRQGCTVLDKRKPRWGAGWGAGTPAAHMANKLLGLCMYGSRRPSDAIQDAGVQNVERRKREADKLSDRPRRAGWRLSQRGAASPALHC